eukprot:2120529-Alexandrium_andersonii.AAC.1
MSEGEGRTAGAAPARAQRESSDAPCRRQACSQRPGGASRPRGNEASATARAPGALAGETAAPREP